MGNCGNVKYPLLRYQVIWLDQLGGGILAIWDWVYNLLCFFVFGTTCSQGSYFSTLLSCCTLTRKSPSQFWTFWGGCGGGQGGHVGSLLGQSLIMTKRAFDYGNGKYLVVLFLAANSSRWLWWLVHCSSNLYRELYSKILCIVRCTLLQTDVQCILLHTVECTFH